MPPEEFLLVPGLAVLVIHGTELAVGGGRCPVATLGQFLIAGDPMFGQEVQRFCGSLQILDGCPVFVAGALLSFATVYKGNIIKNLTMDCQSYTKYRPNETTGGIFVSWRRKEELPTGA